MRNFAERRIRGSKNCILQLIENTDALEKDYESGKNRIIEERDLNLLTKS